MEARKFYKLSTCDYDGYKSTNRNVIGLFSTEEKLKKYIVNVLKLKLDDWGYTHEIEELEVID